MIDTRIPTRRAALVAASTSFLLAMTAAHPSPPGAGPPPPAFDAPRPAGAAVHARTAATSTLAARFEVAGQIGGPVTAVAPAGDRAYAAVGPRVVALDLARWPDHRVAGASAPFEDRVDAMVATGERLYAATDRAGLLVFDILDPAHPVLAGALDGVRPPRGRTPSIRSLLDVAGTHAFVAAREAGLRVVDISAAALPREVARWPAPAPGPAAAVVDVAVAGSTAWVAALGGGLRALDVSDPAAPREVGAAAGIVAEQVAVVGRQVLVAEALAANGERVGFARRLAVYGRGDPSAPRATGAASTPGGIWSMAAAGDYALLSVAPEVEVPRVLWVVDISAPATPRLVAARDVAATGPLGVAGGRVFAPEGAGGLTMIDVGRPKADLGRGRFVPWLPASPVAYGNAVQVSGRHVWVARGTAGLRVLDVGDAARPREVATYFADSNVQAVTIAGDFAYVTVDDARLVILDIRDPAAAREVGALEVDWRPGMVKVQGRHAFVTAGDGLRVLDVADPARPREVGAVALDGPPNDLAVYGSYVYARVGGDLRVIDVTNPARPRERRSFAIPDGSIEAIDIAGGFGFALGYDFSATDAGGTLWSLDLADPGNPRVIGRTRGGSGYSIQVVGARAFVNAGGNVLQVLDIRDPRSVTEAGSLRLPGDMLAVAVTPDRAFVLTEGPSLQVIDARDPTRLSTLGTFDAGSFRESRDVAAGDGYAFAAGNDGLRVFDVRDPDHPLMVGQFVAGGMSAPRVVLHHSVAYLATETDGLLALDVRDPTAPTEVARLPIEDIRDARIEGDRLYLATYRSGLHILDVQAPAAPRALGRIERVGGRDLHLTAIDVAGDHVYALDEDGLVVIEARDPTTPRMVGRLDVDGTDGYDPNVTVVQGHAFVLGDGKVRVVDVRDPAAPRLVRVDERWPRRMRRVPGRGDLVLGVSGFGVRLLDLSDPSRPREMEAYAAGDNAGAVMRDGLVYLAGWDGGLSIVDFRAPAGPFDAAHLDAWVGADALAVDRGHAYLASSRGDLRVVDARSPAGMIETGRLAITPAEAVDAAAGHAYVGHTGGLTVVDVADAAAPRAVAGDPGGWVTGVKVAGGRAFALRLSEALDVFDLADPARPVRLGRYEADADAFDVAGSWAYVAAGGELRVVDFADPGRPRVAGTVEPPPFGWTPTRIAVDERRSRAYVGSRDEALYVVDVADPARPRVLGEPLEVEGGEIHALATHAGRLVVAAGSGGAGKVTVYDFADPAAPRAIAEKSGRWSPTDLRVDGDLVYMSTADAGLWVLRLESRIWLPVGWRGRDE